MSYKARCAININDSNIYTHPLFAAVGSDARATVSPVADRCAFSATYQIPFDKLKTEYENT